MCVIYAVICDSKEKCKQTTLRTHEPVEPHDDVRTMVVLSVDSARRRQDSGEK
jgi:hypothetical protein